VTEETLFTEALEKKTAAERAAFLDEACAGDEALRRRIEALLQSHQNTEFLKTTALERAATLDELARCDEPERLIGPYKLLEPIGEGGMGTVYMAEQTHPVQRKVALKLIKAGLDTHQVIARFEAERQALALMDHPNIAKVLDAGATDSGRPYFVMELVKGVPITRYSDGHRLTPRQRLELFIPVCQAVQHAHQKGIIHRDLKPSNVLIALYDGRPVPKIIDFGVAKATGPRLTERTLYTEFGSVVGTLEYMSPEQAELNQLDVDTRSDIYSLGVLLYELLTGTTPLQRNRLERAALLEALRLIREEEPPRPSTRLSTTEELPSIAAQRGVEPRRLSGLVRGELDWIAMKALEKDRNRRYQTAAGFASDLERHLNGEPVLAGPPTAWYRFGKFAWRHKTAIAVAAATVLAALLALVGLALSNRLVTRQKELKEAALKRAISEKDRADDNFARARRAVKDYLLKTSDSPLLKSSDFQNLRKELLESALPFYQEFVGQAQDDPKLESERGRAHQDLSALRRELGDHAGALDEVAEAEKVFHALSQANPHDPEYAHELAGALITRGVLLNELARFDQAEQAFRRALAIVEPLEAASPRREYRATIAQATSNLGELYRELDRRGDAETTLRRAITLRQKLLEEQPASLQFRGQLAQSWINLGTLLRALRRPGDARKAFEDAVALSGGDAAPKPAAAGAPSLKLQQLRARALNNLATIHREMGRPADAEKAARAALAIKEFLADTFPSVPEYRHELARSFNTLGNLLHSLTRRQDARAAFEKAIGTYDRLAADPDAIPLVTEELAGTYTNLGRIMGDAGQLEESLPYLTKSIEILESVHRKDPRVAKVRESLLIARWARAMTLAGLRRFADALDDWTGAIELDDGRYQSSLRLKRASTLLNLKDHARSAADAHAVAESSNATGENLYDAACALAVCARIAANDASLAGAYAARAVGVLRRAVGKGYNDLAQIKKDSDLDALRAREDFKTLLRELEGRPRKLETERQKTGRTDS
jgi:serine/threonine protein kinase/tetratricopeptide (TPR) repeat protein